eukprot:PhM_4_TR2335/c0_g2_i1/m.50057
MSSRTTTTIANVVSGSSPSADRLSWEVDISGCAFNAKVKAHGKRKLDTIINRPPHATTADTAAPRSSSSHTVQHHLNCLARGLDAFNRALERDGTIRRIFVYYQCTLDRTQPTCQRHVNRGLTLNQFQRFLHDVSGSGLVQRPPSPGMSANSHQHDQTHLISYGRFLELLQLSILDDAPESVVIDVLDRARKIPEAFCLANVDAGCYTLIERYECVSLDLLELIKSRDVTGLCKLLTSWDIIPRLLNSHDVLRVVLLADTYRSVSVNDLVLGGQPPNLSTGTTGVSASRPTAVDSACVDCLIRLGDVAYDRHPYDKMHRTVFERTSVFLQTCDYGKQRLACM